MRNFRSDRIVSLIHFYLLAKKSFATTAAKLASASSTATPSSSAAAEKPAVSTAATADIRRPPPPPPPGPPWSPGPPGPFGPPGLSGPPSPPAPGIFTAIPRPIVPWQQKRIRRCCSCVRSPALSCGVAPVFCCARHLVGWSVSFAGQICLLKAAGGPCPGSRRSKTPGGNCRRSRIFVRSSLSFSLLPPAFLRVISGRCLLNFRGLLCPSRSPDSERPSAAGCSNFVPIFRAGCRLLVFSARAGELLKCGHLQNHRDGAGWDARELLRQATTGTNPSRLVSCDSDRGEARQIPKSSAELIGPVRPSFFLFRVNDSDHCTRHGRSF